MNNNENYINKHADLSVVKNPARIAVYDSLKVPPRILIIKPAPTDKYIEQLTTEIYNASRQLGGSIPYTTIREITENFIHANFSEIVVSILDDGNTIRFADQGPGFLDKETAVLPGFTSATEPMKQYIRGVGSGLPTVKDYIDISEGTLKIDNNLGSGAVVTISMIKNLKESSAFSAKDKENSNKRYKKKYQISGSSLNNRQQMILKTLFHNGVLGVSDIANLCDIPNSTVHKDLTYLQDKGLVCFVENKKRQLSDLGFSTVKTLLK